jgi:hypothetical protein
MGVPVRKWEGTCAEMGDLLCLSLILFFALKERRGYRDGPFIDSEPLGPRSNLDWVDGK